MSAQILQLVALISGFWFIINFIHIALSKLVGEKYNFFLSRNGIFVKFIQIQWHTARFNRVLTKYGAEHSSKLALWFTCGVYFGVLAMFGSIFILLYTFISAFLGSDERTEILTPVVPGINLPNSQIVHYLFTLLLSGIFHEFGHAIAAAREGVSLYGSGLFLALIYPAAFVDLNTESLKICDAFQRLRIFCAGIWHNCILMITAFSLWHALPFLLFFLGYTKTNSAVVLSVQPGSALFNQLHPGSLITMIGDCEVTDKFTWGSCLQTMNDNPLSGHCIEHEMLMQMTREASEDCCNDRVMSMKNLCFTDMDLYDKRCLYARKVLTLTPCVTRCSKGICYKPHPKEGKIFQIIHDGRDSILFTGDPSHLYSSIEVSDYKTRWSFLWGGLPNYVELFLIYMVSLSGALAILNAVPAFYLDGQHIFDAFLDFVLGPGENYKKLSISVFVSIFSSLLIGINVLTALVSVCRTY